MDLLLLIFVIVCLASIGRGGQAHFKVPKTERGKKYMREQWEKRHGKPL